MEKFQHSLSLYKNDQVICKIDMLSNLHVYVTFVLSVPVCANKDIWILGDTFLTEAVAVLREIQNQSKDELYIYSEYDPQIYYPKLLATDTFVSQIRCELYTALEEHNKLPALIIIIVGNKNIDHKVLNPEFTRKVWSALFTEIQRAIKTRKEDLPKKAKSDLEPRICIANLVPRFKEHNENTDLTHESFKTKRRRFNGILPQITNNLDFKVLPINAILPDNADLFVVSNGQLIGKGLKEYWVNLSQEVKILDVRWEEQKKGTIIQEYFEQQREQRRVANEKRRALKDRHSLPRTVGVSHFDRGDGHYNRNSRQDRSRSVSSRRR